MSKPLSEQALRLSAFVQPLARHVGPGNFRAYKRAMLAQREREPPRLSKIKQIEWAIRRPEGASLVELMALTGWQAHSVRGAISAGLRKQRRLTIVAERLDGRRSYRLSSGSCCGRCGCAFCRT